MMNLTQNELIKREKELNLVIEISEAVISELHLDELFKMVVENARKLIGAETVLMPLLDTDLDSYTYRAGCGKNSEEIVGESLPIDFGVCGWVWKHKKPWWRGVLEFLNEDERTRWEKEAGTIILVPLQGKKHFHGGIVGLNKTGGGDFSKRDLDLLTVFASQVSIAIENAHSFEELEKARENSEKYRIELAEMNNKLVSANKELESLALYDHLTGLPNRSLFHDRLQQAIIKAEGTDSNVAVFMLDLDLFKNVNDTLGHAAGDTLLQEVGGRIKSIFNNQITFARLGGDEFALVVPGSVAGDHEHLVEKIKAEFEQPFDVDGSKIQMDASIGIAVFPEHGRDVSALMKCADVAMYSAKKSKSRFTLYNPAEDTFTKDRLDLIGDLKSAIKNNELELYYQPKIDARTGRVCGVEALSRWPHPVRGMIMPDIFVPLAEQSGMAREFTSWVLEEGLACLAAWQKKGIDINISINISMFNLRDPLFPDVLCGIIKKHSISHSAVTLEITESEVMGDAIQIPQVLNELSNRDIRFSVDDFGTGYSSLTHLKKLQVDELKIDKSFIIGMKTNREDEVIVNSIISLGHNLGLKVVAEGVEDHETLEKVLAAGCDEIQGYIYCKPLPEAELLQYILEK